MISLEMPAHKFFGSPLEGSRSRTASVNEFLCKLNKPSDDDDDDDDGGDYNEFVEEAFERYFYEVYRFHLVSNSEEVAGYQSPTSLSPIGYESHLRLLSKLSSVLDDVDESRISSARSITPPFVGSSPMNIDRGQVKNTQYNQDVHTLMQLWTAMNYGNMGFANALLSDSAFNHYNNLHASNQYGNISQHIMPNQYANFDQYANFANSLNVPQNVDCLNFVNYPVSMATHCNQTMPYMSTYSQQDYFNVLKESVPSPRFPPGMHAKVTRSNMFNNNPAQNVDVIPSPYHMLTNDDNNNYGSYLHFQSRLESQERINFSLNVGQISSVPIEHIEVPASIVSNERPNESCDVEVNNIIEEIKEVAVYTEVESHEISSPAQTNQTDFQVTSPPISVDDTKTKTEVVSIGAKISEAVVKNPSKNLTEVKAATGKPQTDLTQSTTAQKSLTSSAQFNSQPVQVADKKFEIGGNNSKFRTEICRNFSKNGFCTMGNQCTFAHGERELKQRVFGHKFKTEVCKSFMVTGQCKYGARCTYIH